MDLEEHTNEPVIERVCAECGTELTDAEIESSLEAGGPYLCTVHAAENVAVDEADASA